MAEDPNADLFWSGHRAIAGAKATPDTQDQIAGLLIRCEDAAKPGIADKSPQGTEKETLPSAPEKAQVPIAEPGSGPNCPGWHSESQRTTTAGSTKPVQHTKETSGTDRTWRITAVFVLSAISTNLGALFGGLEFGYRRYRSGVLLIVLPLMIRLVLVLASALLLKHR